MSFPYASTDSTILSFIAAQNDGPDGRGTSALFAPQLLEDGIDTLTTDNVIGISSLAVPQASIAMGSGFNTVIVDGLHSTTAAASGSADNFYFTVDSTGTVTLTDANTSQSISLSGVSYLIFQGAALGTDAHGNSDYSSMYFIGGANQTEITELYAAALGRQPDLGGVEYYTNELAAGISFHTIAADFMAAPEFQARYGSTVSDSQFIANLYHNVLGRTPSATELSYYENALTNFENGTPGTVNNPSWDRPQELLNFINAPENQADVAGYVVNSAGSATNGLVYADIPNGSETAQQVLTAGATSGTINTALINVSVITAPVTVGNTTIDPASTYGTSTAVIVTYESSGTINLSTAINHGYSQGLLANTATTVINGAPGGGSSIFMDNGTVNLFGTGNQVLESGLGPQPFNPVPVTTVNGFMTGDTINFGDTPGSNTFVLLTPSASAPVNAAPLTFGVGGHTYFINVGNVGGGSLAEVIAAANLVYTPSDNFNENAVFFGSITTGQNSGGTAIYDWAAGNSGHSSDLNDSHQITANEFGGGIILVGVSASSLTTASFAHQ